MFSYTQRCCVHYLWLSVSCTLTCPLRLLVVHCLLSLMICSVFFFFQAEDGIRDRDVTGVQTCALPISGLQELGERARRLRLPDAGGAEEDERAGRAVRILEPCPSATHRVRHRRQRLGLRSEERRVGKECRSRWSPDQ